jgi:2-polyprenyl-6-methoxyphenol hydroxylase-like FAD-dependent oxidoreductase
MPRSYRVGIVGLGVGGSTLSQLLTAQGHAVSVFERAPQVGPVGAGILLQPSGQMVLAEMGLLQRVASLGEPIEALHAITHRGKQLIHLPYADIAPSCCAYGLHRGDLFSVLYEQVQMHGVRVYLDHEIRATCLDRGQVWLEDVRQQRHGPFDFVVAADGGRSTLRGACGLKKWVHPYAYGAVWAIGHSTTIRRKLHQVVRGTKDLLGLLPMGQDRCSLFWSLHRDNKDALWNGGFVAWKEQVGRLCPEAGELLLPFTDVGQLAFTTYQHVWMKVWHDGHVLYLGDAAHAMSPHLGQGVNLALIDAWLFARTLAQSEDYRQAFRRYVRLRTSQLRFYAVVTFLLTPFFQSSGFIKGWGRDLALPLMTRIPLLRRQMQLAMAGLKSGFFGGAWKL